MFLLCYCLHFSPDIESKNVRYALLNDHRAVIGKTRAFDGAVLFLPKMLDEKVCLHKNPDSYYIVYYSWLECVKCLCLLVSSVKELADTNFQIKSIFSSV